MKKLGVLKEARKQLNLLFEPDEYISLSSNIYDTETYKVSDISDELLLSSNYFTINPFKPGTTRRDDNVSVYRNFLIEMDEYSLAEQRAILVNHNIPFTTWTYSGGKSYHVVISLQNPVKTEEEYRQIGQWIFDVLGEYKVDTTSRNPSRWSRLAGAFRQDKMSVQGLMETKSRVSDDLLEHLFFVHEDLIRTAEEARRPVLDPDEVSDDFRGKLTMKTRDFIGRGVTQGGRHKTLYFCAADFKNNNYSQLEAVEALRFGAIEKSGLTEAEFYKTIESAYRRAALAPRF